MSEEQVAEVPEEGVAQSVGTEDWRTSIPEEIREHRSLQHISDVGALAKSYVHAQQMIGADKVVIPGKSATPEEWTEFYAKTGRPDDPGAYEIQPSDSDVPEMVDWFKQTAHELGLSNRQASELFGRYNEFADSFNSEGLVDREQYVAQTEESLRSVWGEAFEDRLENGRAVIEQFGNPEIMEAQLSDGTLLGDNPEFIRLLGDIGDFISQRMGEDQLEGMKVSNAMTVQDAEEELAAIIAPGTPYHDARHPQHDEYVQKGFKLRQLIYD